MGLYGLRLNMLTPPARVVHAPMVTSPNIKTHQLFPEGPFYIAWSPMFRRISRDHLVLVSPILSLGKRGLTIRWETGSRLDGDGSSSSSRMLHARLVSLSVHAGLMMSLRVGQVLVECSMLVRTMAL